MLSFPHRISPMARLPYHHAPNDAEEEFGDFPSTTQPPGRGCRLVQRIIIAGEEAYLIDQRAEHEQHVESHIARHRGDAADQYEYADRYKILRSERLQMRIALDPGVDHIERLGEGRKAKEPAPAGEKVVLITLIVIEILREKQ